MLNVSREVITIVPYLLALQLYYILDNPEMADLTK